VFPGRLLCIPVIFVVIIVIIFFVQGAARGRSRLRAHSSNDGARGPARFRSP